MSEQGYDAEFAKKAAESYERYFVPVIGAPVAEGLIEAAALRPGERVLDVACGTGIVTRMAAEGVAPDGSVAGLDANPGMLAVARQACAPELGIEWHQAPAEAIPLPDDSFDAVLCGMGLQFFSDRMAALEEIRRVLDEGGRFVANLPGPEPPPLRIMAESLSRHVGPQAAGFVHAVFSLHEEDEVRDLLDGAGFSDVDVRSKPTPLDLPAPGDFLWQYVQSTPLAAAFSSLDDEGRAAVEQEYADECQSFVKGGRMKGAVRMTTVVGRA